MLIVFGVKKLLDDNLETLFKYDSNEESIKVCLIIFGATISLVSVFMKNDILKYNPIIFNYSNPKNKFIVSPVSEKKIPHIMTI